MCTAQVLQVFYTFENFHNEMSGNTMEDELQLQLLGVKFHFTHRLESCINACLRFGFRTLRGLLCRFGIFTLSILKMCGILKYKTLRPGQEPACKSSIFHASLPQCFLYQTQVYTFPLLTIVKCCVSNYIFKLLE